MATARWPPIGWVGWLKERGDAPLAARVRMGSKDYRQIEPSPGALCQGAYLLQQHQCCCASRRTAACFFQSGIPMNKE